MNRREGLFFDIDEQEELVLSPILLKLPETLSWVPKGCDNNCTRSESMKDRLKEKILI